MSEVDQLQPVKQGRWFFGGVTACPVRIVRHHMRYGTHDPDDPPALASDREGECFYIRYHPPGAHETWHDGGSALTLREAMFLAQRKLGPVVQWEE